MTEKAIRDALATRLDLLEYGLSLVSSNFALSNAEGTRGFIDILARDRNGSLVVIELKRSNKTAREALHEVTKYVALLQREKGVPAASIRAVTVSTDWAELLVPFSHFARGWEHQLTGFELTLEGDGVTPLSALRVVPLAAVVERGLTPVHVLAEAVAPDEVRTVWENAARILAEVGASDVIGLTMRHPAYGTGLYIALGQMSSEAPQVRALDYLSDDVPADSVEAPGGCVIEYRALCHLTSKYREPLWRPAYADKFGALRQNGWEIVEVFRRGIFEDGALYDDDAVVQDVEGETGLSDVRFLGTSRPENPPHWRRFRANVSRALGGNRSWTELADAWIDDVAATAGEYDIAAKVYNPCDLVTSLVHGWRTPMLRRLVPRLSIALDAPLPQGRIVEGVLAWTGDVCDIAEGFASVYLDDSTWMVRRATGVVWESDLALLDAWHLRYIVCEFPSAALLVPVGTNLARIPLNRDESAGRWEVPGLEPFPEFLEEHADQIDGLVSRLRSKIVVDEASATQLFIDGQASED